jgi:hypothetical protein
MYNHERMTYVGAVIWALVRDEVRRRNGLWLLARLAEPQTAVIIGDLITGALGLEASRQYWEQQLEIKEELKDDPKGLLRREGVHLAE